MHSEAGFRRLVNFSDAVVAIAITLLILPLVDSASNIGGIGLGHFFSENRSKLLAFVLSFVVIGRFWWSQHTAFERLKSYNSMLVYGMFLWLLSIVFLPFPTELIGAARVGGAGVHGLYIGTLLVTSIAGVIQQWAVVRHPELQLEERRGSMTIDGYAASAALTALALVLAVAVPAIGLWSLLALALEYPLFWLRARARRHRQEEERPEVLQRSPKRP
jgi:uncharacterized membrane protein